MSDAGQVFKTRITDLLGIRHPIIQGGMHWVGRAELAAAVSNAGGLGIITGLTQPTPSDLLKEVERARMLCSLPMAVNMTFLPTLHPVPYDDYIAAIVDSGIKIVETAGRSPEPYMDRLTKAGIKVIHKCTSVRHALKAQATGCAAVSVDGFECAGHPGEDDIPNLILLPRAAEELKIPFVASGGFGNGRGLAAALALGADGINMGTRFMATVEAPIHAAVKQRLVKMSEFDTVLLMRPLKNTARYAKNSMTQKVLAIQEAKGSAIAIGDIAAIISGKGGRTVYESGDLEAGVWPAGVVAALIHDVPTCAELIQNIIEEARDIVDGRLRSLRA